MPLLSEQAINHLKAVEVICENLHERIVHRLRHQYDLKKQGKSNRSTQEGSHLGNGDEKSDERSLEQEKRYRASLIARIKREISVAFKAVGRFLGRTN